MSYLEERLYSEAFEEGFDYAVERMFAFEASQEDINKFRRRREAMRRGGSPAADALAAQKATRADKIAEVKSRFAQPRPSMEPLRKEMPAWTQKKLAAPKPGLASKFRKFIGK